MRVLVIGGTGLMGAATVRQLATAGHAVTSASRGGTATRGGLPRPPLPAGVATLRCDRAEEGARFERILARERFDAVVDYAAMTPGHVQGVINAFLRSDKTLRAYLFISTNMVYPGGPGKMDISPLRPVVPETSADIASAAASPEDYGGRKLRCEALLQEAWQEHAFPFSTIRPPSVIGPACDSRHEALQRVAMGLDVAERRSLQPAAEPEGGFRLAFSEDVADLCVQVLAAPPEAVRGEAFNVAMEEAVTLEEYVAACRDAAPAAVAAEWPSKEAAATALAKLGPDYRSYEGQSCLDVSKAKQALGWRPTPFAEAMRATVEWHRPFLKQQPQRGAM